jgi:hypothetical protein
MTHPPDEDNATTWRDLAGELARIEAAFDDHPSCEMTTCAGAQCQRPVRWRIDLHGCEQAIMCRQNKNGWLKEELANLRRGRPRCVHCSREFERLWRGQDHRDMSAALRLPHRSPVRRGPENVLAASEPVLVAQRRQNVVAVSQAVAAIGGAGDRVDPNDSPQAAQGFPPGAAVGREQRAFSARGGLGQAIAGHRSHRISVCELAFHTSDARRRRRAIAY